jgi:hypothetical protein
MQYFCVYVRQQDRSSTITAPSPAVPAVYQPPAASRQANRDSLQLPGILSFDKHIKRHMICRQLRDLQSFTLVNSLAPHMALNKSLLHNFNWKNQQRWLSAQRQAAQAARRTETLTCVTEATGNHGSLLALRGDSRAHRTGTERHLITTEL